MSHAVMKLLLSALAIWTSATLQAEEPPIRIAPQSPYPLGPQIRISEGTAANARGMRIAPPRPGMPAQPADLVVTTGLPLDAQALVSRFNEQSAQIQQQATVQISGLRSELIARLQELQDTYTRNAQLDEAVAIRDRLRQLRAIEPRRAAPAPSIYSLRGQTNRQVTYRITGNTTGYIWGTDIYTDDSELETAAVHAGVLRNGETGDVRVTILEGQTTYSGTTRNGITSNPYQSFGGSYRVDRPSKSTPPNAVEVRPLQATPTVTSLDGRGTLGEILKLNVTGTTTGYVWGSGIYTDDSALGTAAVHAGVLDLGETGIVELVIVAGRSDYHGSLANQVTTYPYSSWSRSFVFVSGPKTLRSGNNRSDHSPAQPQ